MATGWVWPAVSQLGLKAGSQVSLCQDPHLTATTYSEIGVPCWEPLGTVLPRPDNAPGTRGIPECLQIPQCEDHIENSWPKVWGVAGLQPRRLLLALLNN